MNRRKNTKSIWSKFSSPTTNHSVANLMMIDPPASSTTKLLRGKGTGGGCDNHSFYAATGKSRRSLPLIWIDTLLLLRSFDKIHLFQCIKIQNNNKIAAIIPAAARTASAHGSTSTRTTQQIYGASNVVEQSRTSPGQLTGTSAAALSFAAMEQMQMRNRIYSA